MTVEEMVAQLGLQAVTRGQLGQQVTGGYASDMLSCVMARAKAGNVWVTLQAHPNVVAVASLLSLSAVVVTEGVEPDVETAMRAQENDVTLLRTPHSTFTVVGQLAALGVTGE